MSFWHFLYLCSRLSPNTNSSQSNLFCGIYLSFIVSARTTFLSVRREAVALQGSNSGVLCRIRANQFKLSSSEVRLFKVGDAVEKVYPAQFAAIKLGGSVKKTSVIVQNVEVCEL